MGVPDVTRRVAVGRSVDYDVALFESCARSRASHKSSVRLVVRSLLEAPEVRLERFLAAGLIALGDVSCLVGGDLAQIVHTGVHRTRDTCEALATSEFVGAGSRRAVVLAYHVDAGAVGVGGFRYAVGSQQRVGVVAVRCVLLRARAQKAGYIFDTLSPFN